MADPDKIRVFYGGYDLIESAPYTRYLQPAPTANNTAKLLAVYERSHDGQQLSSTLIAACGSPVQLNPDTNYVVSPRLIHVLHNGKFDNSTNASVQGCSMYVLSDEYRPLYGHEEQFQFFSSDDARLPSFVGSVTIFLRIPNPGKRRVSLGFSSGGSGLVAHVNAVWDLLSGSGTFLVFSQTVLSGVPQGGPPLTGVADIAPLIWEVQLESTAGPVFPRACTVAMSFHDEV